jgi:hypothetical protein
VYITGSDYSLWVEQLKSNSGTWHVTFAGEKAPSGEAFDIFVAPLIRDLLLMWEGMNAVDMSKPEGLRTFVLRAILLFTVNDLPAYGLISGQQVKGYKGCPVCTGDTCAEHSAMLKKMVYLGHRRYLGMNHRFRRARVAFDGGQELRPPPRRPSGAEILRRGKERQNYLAGGGEKDGVDDPVRIHGVKRLSVFFLLLYWKVRFRSYIYASH